MTSNEPQRFSMRKAYGRTLVELGAENPEIVVLDADLSTSTQTAMFGKAYPERFFNCGIAEANMVSIAAGLAGCGRIPFVSSFAVFLICKGYDQLRMSVAYPGMNVKVVATHGGISVGEDGPSQHAVEDLALMLSLPGFRVIVPADDVSAAALVRCVAGDVGPAYLRLARPDSIRIHEPGTTFRIGGSIRLSRGDDVTIVSMGYALGEAVRASEALAAEEGFGVDLIDAYSVRPLDGDTLLESVGRTGGVIVVEEHESCGGLGSEVARFLARERPVPIEFVDIGERYAESGSPQELLERYGVSSPAIQRAARRLIARKGGE